MKNKIKGTGTALITPFYESGAIDFQALEYLIEYEIKNHVDFLVALGTTSEYPSLSRDEQNSVLDFIGEKVNRRVPVVAGVSDNSTHGAVEKLKNLKTGGIDAILSVTPYYNKPQPQGQYQHFKAVAEASPLPVILYNVPGRTGTNMSAETILQLAQDFDNIIGVKEASGDLNQVMKIILGRPESFLVFSGEDFITLPMLGAGADGVISVIANAYPYEFSEMLRNALNSDMETARKYHYKLYDLIDAIFKDGNPAGIKAALEVLGHCRNILRLPLAKVNESVNSRIKKAIEVIEDEQE